MPRITRSGRGCLYPLRLSGRRPPEELMGDGFHGGIRGTPRSAQTVWARDLRARSRLVAIQPGRVRMGQWTWRGTCGNGARTGAIRTTTRARRLGIQRARQVVAFVCRAGARGKTAAPTTNSVPTANATPRRAITPAAVFVAPGLRDYNFAAYPRGSVAGFC